MPLDFLRETFDKLDRLNEEAFELTDDGIDELKDFEDENQEEDDTVDVIDPTSETEEEANSSAHVGQVICECKVCHSNIFLEKEDIEYNIETEVCNENEDCPFCGEPGGFMIVGEISKFTPDGEKEEKEEETEEESDLDDEVEETEEKETDESLTEGNVATAIKNKVTGKFAPTDKIYDLFVKFRDEHKDSVLFPDGEIKKIVRDTDYYVGDIRFTYKTPEEKKKAKELANQLKSELVKIGTPLSEIDIVDNYFGEGDHQNGIDISVWSTNSKKAAKRLAKDKESIDESALLGGAIAAAASGFGSAIGNKVGDKLFGEEKECKDCEDDEVYKSKHLCKGEKCDECNESIDNISFSANGNKVTADDEKITIEADTGASDVSEEVVSEVSPETAEEIVNNAEEEASEEETTEEENTEEEPSEEEEEVDVEEVQEESFNRLGTNFLKRTYENVESFRTTSIRANDRKMVLEGIISFKSGAEKKTSFIFEASTSKNGKLKFIGENKDIARGNKAFLIEGKLDNKSLIVENLRYNYRAKTPNGKSVRVSGTVKNDK